MEDDDGNVLALVVIEEQTDEDKRIGLVGWRSFLPGKRERDGNVYECRTPLQSAARAAWEALRHA